MRYLSSPGGGASARAVAHPPCGRLGSERMTTAEAYNERCEQPFLAGGRDAGS